MSKIFIISGPSGAGEDSIISKLSEQMPIERVTTTTTRAMREVESQGNPYYFISREEFEKGIEEHKFFEYAKQYNDNLYGVTFDEIKRVQDSGKIGIWKIDYKGVINAKKLMPDIKAILISAPLDILEKRIRERFVVSDEFVNERMEYTKEWFKHKDIYDHEVVNEQGKLDEAVAKVAALIKMELAAK